MEKEERLSKTQLKILTLLYEYHQKPDDRNTLIINGEDTGWRKNWCLYHDLRKKLRIRKLTIPEVYKKANIPLECMPIRHMTMGIMRTEQFENQWDDSSLKASYSRSIKNLQIKKLIDIGYTKEKPREKVIAFTQKGYDLICKKLKITQETVKTQEEQHGT